MSESTIKCENCEEEFTDKESYESHRELSHENDSFQFIDSRDAVDEQEFVRINGKREYNPNPNAGLYDNKLFREGSAKERTSILGEHHDGTDHEHPHEEANEFTLEQFKDNEEINYHSENALELVKLYGTPDEIKEVEDIVYRHHNSGRGIDYNDRVRRDELMMKYYPRLENDSSEKDKSYQSHYSDSLYNKWGESKANEWLDSSYQDELLYSKYYKELETAQNMIRDGNTNPDGSGRPIFKHHIADYLWNTLGLDGVPSDKLDEMIDNLYKLEGKVAESLDEEQSEDYLEARDELIADAIGSANPDGSGRPIGSERLGSKNPFKIGNEFFDTYTCTNCGKVGTDFGEMVKEICPEGNGGGHVTPILGDEAKANEYEEDEYDEETGELLTPLGYDEDEWIDDSDVPKSGHYESIANEDDYQHNFNELTSLAQDKIEDGGISQDTWDGSSKEERKDIESELHGESEDVDYEKEDELSAGFIEQQHTEPKEDKNKELDDVDISLEKIDYVYPTKVGEAKKKSYVTEAIDGLDEEYNHEEPSDEEEIVDLVTSRKMSGYSDESIARELHITYGVDPDYARNRVYGIEVSTNDKVANTFFGKMYRECTESEKDELKMYSGSDY